MNINVKLSDESIQSAINKLQKIRDYFSEDSEKLVDILTNEGAEIAQAAYGSWPVSAVPMSALGVGTITVYGDELLIAEFGAGDATLNPSSMFEHAPNTDVFPGSYSRENAQQYWKWGSWYFGGRVYSEVAPHMGLYQAKRYLIEHSTEIAREVIQFD